MKFTCKKSSIQEAISIAQKAVTGKSTMPILQGILLNASKQKITIIGSDIDLSIETKFDAEIEEEGTLVVDSKIFGEIIKKLPGDILKISTQEDNSMQIVCNKFNATLVHKSAENFPEIPIIDENIMLNISQKKLKNMIRKTLFAVAQDETRPILTGILFEVVDMNLNMVALDGFRLAVSSEFIDDTNNISAVIPGKTLSEVSKVLDETNNLVNITFTPNHILFNLGETKIVSRLLEGEFIKYNSIIPEEYKLKITLKKDELLGCIERASLLAKEGNTNLVKFDIKEDSMIITSNSQLGKVREELNIILKGEELQIAFNSRYIIDVLKIMEEEEIVMEFTSSVSPCVIKNNEVNNCTYLVLPVRLLNK